MDETIEVGDIVICVDNEFAEDDLHNGRLYRVGSVYIDGDYEVYEDLTNGAILNGYYLSRFKKVVNYVAPKKPRRYSRMKVNYV